LTPVRAVRFGGALQIFGGIFIIAAHQRHLRQRVVDGAGGLVKLHRAAHFECAMQQGFSARQIADADANLAQRGERDGEALALAEAFLECHGALGKRERLIVAVADQRDVRLVDADHRKHVVGGEGGRLTFREPERRVGLVVAARLRQHHAGE
jgi:hypothetical protein